MLKTITSDHNFLEQIITDVVDVKLMLLLLLCVRVCACAYCYIILQSYRRSTECKYYPAERSVAIVIIVGVAIGIGKLLLVL